MQRGKVRLLVLGYSEAAVRLLNIAMARQTLYVCCGVFRDWQACEACIHEVLPDVVLAAPGSIPSGWDVTSTSVLHVVGSPALAAASDFGAVEEEQIEALLRELGDTYHEVLREKGHRLRLLLLNYQQCLAPHSVALRIRQAGEEKLVPIEHIEWIEAAGNWVHIHAEGTMYRMREMMNDVLDRLPSSDFLRIHRSTVVNRSKVASVQVQNSVPVALVMDSGISLNVGVTFRESLRDDFSFEESAAS